MDMLGGEGVGKQCRTADIIADAAYAILSHPKDYTGRFLVDEDILREQGVTNFEQYAVQPGHALLPDFFLDDSPESLVQKMEQHGKTHLPTCTVSCFSPGQRRLALQQPVVTSPLYLFLGATPAFKPPSSSATPTSGGPVENTFDVIKGAINEDVVKSTQGIYQFDLSGKTSLFMPI